MAKRAKTTTDNQGQNSYHEPDHDRAVELVMQLMAIPGKSGEEAEVAEFVRQQMLRAGVKPEWIQSDSANRRAPVRSDTGNLIVKLPGKLRGPRCMLAAHLDTVPICVGSQPVRQNEMVRSADPKTGLGADDRAGVAATLSALLEIVEHDLPHPPLTFCWFVQEETGLHGARCVTKKLLGNPRLVFNFDGGSPTKLTIGATGGFRLRIDVHGMASHAGGAPEWGVSAIAIASLAIADLQRNGWHGDIRKGRRAGTSNVGFIHGGEATNVVTDFVSIRAEARSHDPKFRQRIVLEIEKAFERAIKEVKNVAGAAGSVQFHGGLDYESFRLNKKEPCVVAARNAVKSIGEVPEFAIANGGLDANWLTKHGWPTVSLGAGQLNQHMVSESLDLVGYRNACRIALRLATSAS